MNAAGRPKKATIEDKFALDITSEVDTVIESQTETASASDEAIAEARRNARAEVRSRTRTPLHKRSVLNFPQRPGYKRRVVNDVLDGERVAKYIDAGWEVVQKPNIEGGDTRAGADSQLATAVSRSVGGGVKGILMEIREDWYNEDQAAKMEMVDRTEVSIKRKKRTAKEAEDGDGTYGEVVISR